ncbi:MAG TPA: DUF885 domain-containing protein [Mobilitalea sp.]|nr:DUF885 domain-containing protein [Mobilitalea sp.]
MQRKIRYYFTIITVFCFSLLLSGCNKQDKQLTEQQRFNTFLNDLFVLEVQSDSLSMNYSLAAPEKYGIKEHKATLGEYSIRHMTQDMSSTENYLTRLQSFNYNNLSSDQKLTYQIVKNYLEQDLNFGDFMYYNECLGPTTGIQAQLPILLAEYSFYDKSDIDEYIDLLSCVYDYFSDIVQYEREKSEHGLFMNNAVATHIIEQCKSFIKNPEENFLIQYFDEKISSYSGLTPEEVTAYKARNKEAVLVYVIPAYEMLINNLVDLLGTGTNEAGLYYYPEGQAYYECLAKYKTGSSKSMEEMTDMLDTAIADGLVDITSLSMKDPKLVDKYLSFTSFPITDPQEIITDLKKDIAKDFPAAVPVNCKIKYVPESLSDYLSPAMYLIPPIDNYTDNNIYINGHDAKTLSMIYTTVAHEGYPGHLYQCVYFRSKNPSPIRNLMNFVGYDEGWATYVEMYSYHISGIDETLADFLEANNVVILCMYARADIGIHYEGWTKKTVVNYVNNYIGDEEIAASIYNTLLEEPAIYLPYAIGYLEIKELRKKAEMELGDQFVAKDFHEFLLDIGPAQFGIIDDYMNQWIKKMKK